MSLAVPVHVRVPLTDPFWCGILAHSRPKDPAPNFTETRPHVTANPTAPSTSPWYHLPAVSQKDIANALTQLEEQVVLNGPDNLSTWDEVIRLPIVQLGLFPHICTELSGDMRRTWRNSPIFPSNKLLESASMEENSAYKVWEGNDYAVLLILTSKISDNVKCQLPCTVHDNSTCISAREYYGAIHKTWGMANVSRMVTIRDALFQTKVETIGLVAGYTRNYRE
ncbi:hypothetical protein V5O48_019089 [Marasmius crinis-equi]|uniref:Uncharacterized protein n=1 Tax=Marasmius crinis-equi TaxID=585013 RepID=A0ABR3EJG2_9AGAR